MLRFEHEKMVSNNTFTNTFKLLCILISLASSNISDKLIGIGGGVCGRGLRDRFMEGSLG
jgi:hypothetical protein